MNKRHFIKKGIALGLASVLWDVTYWKQMLNTYTMKHVDVHIALLELLGIIRNHGNDVEIQQEHTLEFERFINDEDFQQKFTPYIQEEIDLVKASYPISINEDQQFAFTHFSPSIRWQKVDRFGPHVPLKGGFSFSEGAAMMLEPTDGWKTHHDSFLKYETESEEDKALLAQLIWFESPTAPNENPFIPYYGCVRPNGINFPSEFYFYDGGIVYPLPFSTYAEYIKALIANAGVHCWQYFYVAPELLVTKNKGLNYMTTFLRGGTQLVENLRVYQYDPSLPIDRLDIISEYINRVVSSIPEAFPTLNFDHQKDYLELLRAVMKQD